MNDLKRLSILCLLVLTTAINGFTQDSTATEQPTLITFEEALRISMTNNYGIKEAECISNLKQEEMKAAKGLYLPQISLNASWIEMSEDIHLDLTPVRDAITPAYEIMGNFGTFSGVPIRDPQSGQILGMMTDEQSTQAIRMQILGDESQGVEGILPHIENAEWNKTIQEKSFGYVSAGFTYPLYVGGKIRMANKAANIRYQESLNELDLKNQQVTVELVERYYALVLAHEALEVRKEVFNTMKLHLNDAKRLMEEGIISNAEYLHAKVYFSEADRELKKASRQIAIARQGLINTLAMEENTEVIPATQLFFTDNVPPLDYYLASVETNSQLIKKVNYKKELADVKYRVDAGRFMPTIAAMGTYDIVNKDLSPYLPHYMVGVGLKWNVFQGASRVRNVQAAKLQQQQVEQVYHKATSDISTAITKFYQETQMYMEQMHELESASQFAEEYYRVRKKAFSEGMATAAEVSDADLAVAKVQIEKLVAQYQFDVALAKTLYYSGKMHELNNFTNQ